MKKVFQSAIVLSPLLLSCTNEADITENITGVVGFHTADVAASRAGILDTDTLHKYGFRVHAYSTGTEPWASAKDTATPEFMYNEKVTWTGSAWTYTPAKYWPGKVDGTHYGKLSFFAWNEGTGATVSGNDEHGAPTLTYTVPNAHADQKDLVVADTLDQTVNTNNGAVSLAFGHVLSRIGFTARLEEHYDDVTIRVTSLKVKYATGKVRRTDDYTFGTGWALTGTDCMSHTGGGDVLVDAPVALNNDETPAKTPLTTDTRANYLMLLPQTVADGDVTIDVAWTVDDGVGIGGPYYETIPLPTQIWLPGKCYDYSLKVSMTGITLDPVLVNPWGDDDLYKACTITYNANGGTGEDIVEYRTTNVTYSVGGQYFGRDLYRIRAWTTKPDGTGDTYTPGGNITCTEDLTLYARWEPVYDGMSNCYMVEPGQTLPPFPVSRAYTYEKETFTNTLRTGGEYTGDFEAEVVWDDNNVINGTPSVSGSGSNAEVIVNTHNHSGNAVVKIYKAGDSTPVWSYHIWVTDPADIVPWENTNQPGYIFMDRNLGATEAANSIAGRGLLYQWGRKDPFPGGPNQAGDAGAAGYVARDSFTGLGTATYITGTDYAGSGSTTADQIIASIQYPTVFFSNVSNGDWLSTREDALWNVTNDNNQYKTIYDPCPADWRVPVHVGNQGSADNSPWAGLRSSAPSYTYGKWTGVADAGGVDFNGRSSGYTTALYPAAGYRSHEDGHAMHGGSIGYYWSASVGGDKGCYLQFKYNGRVEIAEIDSRARGFSVRCVRDIVPY